MALVGVKKGFGGVAWPWRVRQDLGGGAMCRLCESCKVGVGMGTTVARRGWLRMEAALSLF